MKGAAPVPHKRGCGSLGCSIFALVLLSLLVPLFFLVNQSGYSVEEQRLGAHFKRYDLEERTEFQNHPRGEQDDHSEHHVEDLMKKLEPKLSKEIELFAKESDSQVSSSTLTVPSEPKKIVVDSASLPVPPPTVVPRSHPVIDQKEKVASTVGTAHYVKSVIIDEAEKSCQLEFGSYCLWRDEHKEEMRDSMVKKLKDQLFVARAYYPSIAKLPAQDKLSREMKMNIQDFERMLSEATTDADLPPQVEKKVQSMDSVTAKAKGFPVVCSNVDKKLRQILDLTEDEAHFHMKQSAFLYQLGVQTMPKSLHCLSMRLTVEYFRSHAAHMELLQDDDTNQALHHFVIFTNQILGASVVINSTTMHSKETENQVFHVVTDGQNYIAMRHWFLRNNYKNATIKVLNIEELNLRSFDGIGIPLLSISDEFRVSIRSAQETSSGQMRTEYVSLFGPTHFLLPEIFPNLKKVIVLDDDVVVQRDLSSLWNLEMEGKVNGAVEYCRVRLGQLNLDQNSFNSNSCVWMSGVNVIDLEKWREQNVTETYQRHLMQKQQSREDLSRSTRSFQANLFAFQNLIYALDNSWALSGLGHDYGVNTESINSAAVLHYNGEMKPWLELGIPEYKQFWKRFLMREDQFMDDCNVNP